MTKKVAIVYASYDGVINLTSGVGVLSRYFINQFPEVRKHFSQSSLDLSLHVVAVDQSEDSHGYSKEIEQDTKNVCEQHGGSLHLIGNGTQGDWGYGDYKNWNIVSSNLAVKIHQIENNYDLVITFLVDTPFLGTPYYYQSRFSGDKVRFVLTPHSDTFSHFSADYSFLRLQWESASFQLVNIDKNTFIAFTSKYLQTILEEHYKFNASKVIEMQTGLVVDDQRFKKLNREEIELKLDEYDIPKDKKLIFSVGRAVPYKGFEELLNSFAKLLSKSEDFADSHLVFIASPYLYKGSSSNINTLKKLIRDLGISSSCTPIYQLDMDLPKAICQWGNTKIVAQLSSREPFGLVPEEVRLWAKKEGPIIIASNVDGHLEQIENGKDGFLVNAKDIEETANCFANVLRMDDNQLRSIRKNGLERVMTEFNYTKNVISSLEQILNADRT